MKTDKNIKIKARKMEKYIFALKDGDGCGVNIHANSVPDVLDLFLAISSAVCERTSKNMMLGMAKAAAIAFEIERDSTDSAKKA